VNAASVPTSRRCGRSWGPALSRGLHSRAGAAALGRPRPATTIRDDSRLQGVGPWTRGGRQAPVRTVNPRGRFGHARRRTRRRHGNGGILSHDQANPAGPGPRGLTRWRGRRVQHPGRHRRPDGRSPVHTGLAAVRLGRGPVDRAIGRAKRLVSFRSSAPRIFGSGAFCLPIWCNVRATRRTANDRRLQCVALNALGRLRRRREENLQRRGDRGPWSIRDPSRDRPSGNAALAETTTSAVPHLTVRPIHARRR
jgi:hypothetical protein